MFAMPPALAIPLIIAVVALLILSAILSAKAERARFLAMTKWCRDNGWQFDPWQDDNPRLDYPLFGQGHSRYLRWRARKRVKNAVLGLGDAAVDLFEYHYAVTTSNGKTTTTTHYWFVCARVEPGVELGRVLIRPETWSDKLAGAIGFDDIDFEDAQFSKRYFVKAPDRRQAYELIDGPMMRFLCAANAPHIETNGRELFVHASGRADAQRYAAMAEFAASFLAQLPRPLVNAERARKGLPAQLEAGNAAASSRKFLEDLERPQKPKDR
jgi:hypothetical protein